MDTSPHLSVVTFASLVLHYTVYYFILFSSQRSPTHIVHINEFHFIIMYGHESQYSLYKVIITVCVYVCQCVLQHYVGQHLLMGTPGQWLLAG